MARKKEIISFVWGGGGGGVYINYLWRFLKSRINTITVHSIIF
jgi:hypothetical protein